MEEPEDRDILEDKADRPKVPVERWIPEMPHDSAEFLRHRGPRPKYRTPREAAKAEAERGPAADGG